jgi:small nuclear ribonucleoprotein (snRNP)-like protein
MCLRGVRVNEDIIVRLKWGQTEYKGRLISVDSYMNIQLSGTEEFIDGQSTGSLGQVLIRYLFPCLLLGLKVKGVDFCVV